MKRVRRIVIETAHTYMQLCVASHPPPEGTGTSVTAPMPCARCGADWLLLETLSFGTAISAAEMKTRTENLGLHLERSSSGHWWICRRSIEELTRK